jgi:hypothetical protein
MTGGDSSRLALHTTFTHDRRQNPLLRIPTVGDNAGMQSDTPKAEPKRKRRWFQFSLRTLMIGVTLVAIPCGWFGMKVERARKRHQAVETIRKLGGYVHYDYEMDSSGFSLLLTPPPAPDWLINLLGIDFFADVAMVELPSSFPPDLRRHIDDDKPPPEDLRLKNERATVICLKQLPVLPHITNLKLIETQVTDDQLKYLEGLEELQMLWLNSTPVGDAGLVHLQKLPQLRYLVLLFDTRVTDAGLKHLQGMSQLRELSLDDTNVTGAGKTELKKALPKCEITYYHSPTK